MWCCLIFVLDWCLGIQEKGTSRYCYHVWIVVDHGNNALLIFFWRYIPVAVGYIIPKDCLFDTIDRWPLSSVCCSHILLSIWIPSILRWRYCCETLLYYCFCYLQKFCYNFLIHDSLRYFSKRLSISKIKKTTLFSLLSKFFFKFFI